MALPLHREAGVVKVVIPSRHNETVLYDLMGFRVFGIGGTVMLVHSDYHSDFEAGQLALLSVAAIVLLVFALAYVY
jgi:hypothetical protein